MSTPNGPGQNGPSKRRRIAGESKPGAPTPPPRPVVRKQPPAAAPEPVEDAAPVEVEPTAVVEPATEDAPVEEAPVEESASDDAPARAAAPRVGGRRPVTDDAPSEAAGEPDAEVTDESKEPRRLPSAGRTVLVLLAVAAVVFGGWFGFRGVQDLRDVDGAHAEAAESAASAAETIFSYRYDRIEQYLEDSREVMTDSFADDFETISPALSDLAPQRQIQVEATTRDAAAEPCGDDCDRDEATVLVFVDQARLADGSTTPTVFGNRVEMTMVHEGGRWLVDDVKAL